MIFDLRLVGQGQGKEQRAGGRELRAQSTGQGARRIGLTSLSAHLVSASLNIEILLILLILSDMLLALGVGSSEQGADDSRQ